MEAIRRKWDKKEKGNRKIQEPERGEPCRKAESCKGRMRDRNHGQRKKEKETIYRASRSKRKDPQRKTKSSFGMFWSRGIQKLFLCLRSFLSLFLKYLHRAGLLFLGLKQNLPRPPCSKTWRYCDNPIRYMGISLPLPRHQRHLENTQLISLTHKMIVSEFNQEGHKGVGPSWCTLYRETDCQVAECTLPLHMARRSRNCKPHSRRGLLIFLMQLIFWEASTYH